MKTLQEARENPPGVFISYSWTDEQHRIRVLDLATRLRQDGVDVKLDRWDLKEGQDKYKFMESMVNDEAIEKVLMICDHRYKEKSDQREGGVGEETQIISPEVYKASDQTKFIPVIFERDDTGEPYLPTYLEPRIFIDFSDPEMEDKEYEKLLRAIFGNPEDEKPPLGSPPQHIFEEKSKRTTKTVTTARRIKYDLQRNQKSVIGQYENYLNQLLTILEEDFAIDRENLDKPFDEAVIEKIDAFLPYRDEFIEIHQELFKYRSDVTDFIDRLHDFFESFLVLLHVQSDHSNWDQYRFIAWELFLHVVALMIRRRKLEAFNQLLNRSFYYVTQHHKKLYAFAGLNQPINSLNYDRKKRLGTNRRSIAVDSLIERTTQEIQGNEIKQADLILFLKSYKAQRGYAYWVPSTLRCARSAYSENLEFFIRAEEKGECYFLLQFIDHKDKEDLISTIQNNPINQSSYYGPFFSLTEITNINNLSTH